jgi:serine/threonine protein kinase
VALKKVRFDTSESESVRFMAREMMILRRLDHPNVIRLDGIATSRMHRSIYLVFDFMYSDLTRIICRPDHRLTEPQVRRTHAAMGNGHAARPHTAGTPAIFLLTSILLDDILSLDTQPAASICCHMRGLFPLLFLLVFGGFQTGPARNILLSNGLSQNLAGLAILFWLASSPLLLCWIARLANVHSVSTLG